MPIAQVQTKEETLIPFIRWAGGKRWLIKSHPEFLPTEIEGRYIEPFLGGGALFAELLPERSLLSDLNPELINLYHQVKQNGSHFHRYLSKFEKRHSHDFYYEIRNTKLVDPFDRAIRFLYLNRTCFNGIYRVNRSGVFNVPIGSKSKVVLPSDEFHIWSEVLQKAKIICCDFETIIDDSEEGDFVFADPPYTVSHNKNGFLKYNEVLFSKDDQERLASTLTRAHQRGVRIVATNANHPFIHEIYSRSFHISEVTRVSNIAASTGKRGKYSEIVIINHVR